MIFLMRLIVKQKIEEVFSSSINEIQFSSVSGGSINEAYCITVNNRQVFCKINSASKFPHLFEKEKSGLALIQKQNAIKTPGIVAYLEVDRQQVLLLNWIREGERTKNFWKKFGTQLAILHQQSNNYFGLDEDNYMGSVPQNNQQTNNWIDFFIRQRLEPLIAQCTDQKLLTAYHQKQFEKLYLKLSTIFNKVEKPSLLHGDLWSGNFMCNENSEPVLIDPAVYFGHPSADLAMTTLFGGFQSSFYEAYHYHSPFPANYKEQWQVCNFYPLLIHLFLFGRNYLVQIEQALKQFA